MRLTFLRAIPLALAIFTLVLPASERSAFAQGTQGPQKPPPQQQQQEQQQQQGQPNKPATPQQQGQYAINVEVPLVNVDVVATTNNGGFIQGLRKENFRLSEDGVPQTITNFSAGEAPITLVMLMEFSKIGYGFWAYNAQVWGFNFLQQLKPADWVALETYDLQLRLEADFTQDKQQVANAITRLMWPGFTEANLFDALSETLERLKDVKGKKSILLLGSGCDTFSKHTLDQTLKTLRQTDVTIFAVSMTQTELGYFSGGSCQMGAEPIIQAENQLRSFSEMTGGQVWYPRFQGEIPSVCQQIALYLRNQYSLGYVPTNQNHDGKTRKIKVEIVNADGTPFVPTDPKGKKLKVVVYARKEYTIPKSAVTLNLDSNGLRDYLAPAASSRQRAASTAKMASSSP